MAYDALKVVLLDMQLPLKLKCKNLPVMIAPFFCTDCTLLQWKERAKQKNFLHNNYIVNISETEKATVGSV